jgi:hypothetical protein
MSRKDQGWHGEFARHSLAAKGVKTRAPVKKLQKLYRVSIGRNTAKSYVEELRKIMVKNKYAVDFYDFILQNGKSFRSRPSPDKLPNNLRSCSYKTKECFYNAQMISLLYGYDYYEGFANSIIPTEHAWVVTQDNVLIDLTWDKVAEPEEELDYFGVHIPREFISKQINKTGNSTDMMRQWFESQRSKEGCGY